MNSLSKKIATAAILASIAATPAHAFDLFGIDSNSFDTSGSECVFTVDRADAAGQTYLVRFKWDGGDNVEKVPATTDMAALGRMLASTSNCGSVKVGGNAAKGLRI